MILAAGPGERMHPLTENTPKPMLAVAGKPLLQHHIEALAKAGFTDLIINHGRFGYLIESCFGDGSQFGVNIHYSAEGERPLETGGGIKQALGLLGSGPFLVVNGDIWTDFPLQSLTKRTNTGLAHLIMAPNPPHHPDGDFAMRDGMLLMEGAPKYTFSGIGLYSPALFAPLKAGRFPLAPLLRRAIGNGQISGEIYTGHWFDIGTAQRLARLDKFLAEK